MGFFGRRSSTASSTSVNGSSTDVASSATSIGRSSSTRVKAKSLNLGPSLDSSASLNSRRLTGLTVSVQHNGSDSYSEGHESDESDQSEEEAEPKAKRTGSKVHGKSDSDSDTYLNAATGAVGTAIAAVGLTKFQSKGSVKPSGSGKARKRAPSVSSSSDSESASESSSDRPPKKPTEAKGAASKLAVSNRDGYESPASLSSVSSIDTKEGNKVATPFVAETKSTRKPRKDAKALKDLTFEDVRLTEEELREDISEVWQAMHLFMNSRMIEAEDICLSAADHRLYFSVGYTLIQCIKSLMTFEPEDLAAAVQCCKDSLVITGLLRKKDHSLSDRFGSLAKGTISVGGVKGMTVVQRHAELVYAECLLLKAVIGIIYSGDFIAFLKEALNMRTAYAIYRTLAKFVEEADEKAAGGEDFSIDNDFRSGVSLGNGLISLILSLLPSTVLKIMEVFGFTGDREYALRTLMAAGKWSSDPRDTKPGMKAGEEGIRRQVCDMALLFHHLVISSYLPVTGVDIGVADKVLHYNLNRYTDGVFFLYFSGRLYSTQTLGERAIKQFRLAIQAQREYIQLQHICHWDLALTFLSLGQFGKAYECFNILDKESNWSKAIYAYAKGVTAYEVNREDRKATQVMKSVPDLMQRIAGKSIPLEKFVARKSRKFLDQGNRLVCPGIELAYVLNCLGMSPRFALFEEHLAEVSRDLAEIHQCKDPSTWGSGKEFWDDYCLAHLLRGIILRLMAHPEKHTTARPAKCPIPIKEADEQALISFNNVFKHGREIQQDHHVVWFAHYELGRLYSDMGEYDKAEEQLQLVMSGKGMEVGTKKGKGKVSLQNMVVLRTNAALEMLKEKRAAN